MICSACGFENPSGMKFCGECAAPLKSRCPHCGGSNPPGFKFCGQCAAPLGSAPVEPRRTLPADPRAGTALPRHLAEKIRQSRSALEGERKQVTVLFADVKGSMELAEQLDPEEWSQIMSRFFQILAEGVERFEGFVDKFTGDGIMALFGAPIAHEDHAQRACDAALQLRDAVREYANEVRVRHGIPFGVRIGLNSGEVVVGRIGDDLRMEFTAQGHTVGLAQRMEALAESGHIVVSEHTARLVEGYFQLQDLGRTKVKGVAEAVGLFDLTGVGSLRTRFDRSRARGLSTFVGRDGDMAVLETALERARGSGGQIVGIVAEAGTGKSRLCAEFVDGCRARGIPILVGRGVAHGKAIPMLPMLEVWRAFYGITDADSPETTRAKIAGRLLMMDEGFREVLPILFDVFGVSDPANPSPAIDSEQRQKRIHGVVKRILHDPAYGGTRVFLLEDLHWFDGASDAFLETAIESVPATRDLWLVNFRPEYQARWMQRSYYQHLSLQPLGPEAIRALLRDQLGDDPSVAALPDAIHERTRGNPFFIEEVVQSLVESGQLAGARGAYRLTTPVAALQVPSSVQAVLAARIDRLPEREKQVLQTAAVIGQTFAESLLQRVVTRTTALGEADLDASLSALTAAEFLYEAALYPQVEYSFKHPLTQEVALRSQLRERRVRVHAAVADALEEAGSNLDERAAEIARHWAEADERGRAARWHRRAAEWAGLTDPREALHHWRRVRELVSGVEDPSERAELTLEACHRLLSLGWRMGGSEEEAAAAFAEGRALAEGRGDHRALATLVDTYGVTRCLVEGSALDYVLYAEEAALLVQEHGDAGLRAALGTYAGFAHQYAGNGGAALAWAARVLDEVGPDARLGKDVVGYSPRVAALVIRVWASVYLGRLEEAWNQIREAERIAQEARELDEVLSWVHYVWALVACLRGGPECAVDHARHAVDIAERLDNEASRMLSYQALGWANLADAQPAAACNALRESLAIARNRRVQAALIPWVLAVLAEAHLALGERTEALAAAREGIELGRAGGGRYFEAHAHIALAAALLAADDVVPGEEIESALTRADELVASIEARSLSPRILELRGRLAMACGDAPAAARFLRQALDLYRAIGATGHAERLAGERAG